MFSFAKFLRISLPIATGACAIVATSLLVASFHDKDKLKKNENDEILKDFDKPTEEFKEEKIINEEKKEVDAQQKQGDQGPSDKKQELNEDQEKAARKELVQKVMEGQKVVLGENTLRGNDSLADPKEAEGVELPMPNIPSSESSPPEGDSLTPKAEDQMSSVAPDESKVESENPIQGNDDELEETEATSKAEELQEQVEAPKENSDKDPNSDDAGMQDGEDDMEEEIPPAGTQDLAKAENQEVGDREGDQDTVKEAGPPSEVGDEDATDQEFNAENDSRGGDDDGIEGGTAEEAIPDLDLLNSLESKLNKEIDSLGSKLRNLGINF